MYDDHMNARRKAHAATVFFGFLAAGVIAYRAPYTPLFLPDSMFVAMLLAHTYLSVDLFARIQTDEWAQWGIDALLLASYAWLVLSIGTTVAFFFANLALFIVAPIKYAHLIERIPHHKLLRRKILVDLSGTALAASMLGIALLGYPTIAAWTLTILFALASVRYLVTHPLYRL